MKWILILTTLIFFSPCINSQQNYSGNTVFRCRNTETTKPSDSFLYTCNGRFSSCKSFLIFTANSQYNTVASIAALTSSDQSELAKFNNATISTVFPAQQEVIIPVHCSCSHGYYSSITTYQNIPIKDETYFTIANNTFQGLATCDGLQHANRNDNGSHELLVPLRCACPTNGQMGTGTKYLLTYSINFGDTIYTIGQRFNVNLTRINEANNFSNDHYQSIYPFTTILVPLLSEPAKSHTKDRGSGMTKSPLPVPSVQRSRSKSNTILSAAGIAAGILSLIIILILLFIFLFHKNRKQVQHGRHGHAQVAPSSEELILEIAKFRRTLKVFEFSEIKKATRDFRSRNRIKGCVYHGTIKREVYAIKKDTIGNSNNNEVKMLHQINHINIVKLHGFCQHKENVYLVSEYMKNGSLHEWLMKGVPHDWTHRISIALDVANGLLYLHSFTSPAYVHNDIRSCNILLDGNLRAKIGNFSLARKANSDVTTECLGPGAGGPEVDVFAFGVVLLELVTGKCPVFLQGGTEKLLWIAIAEIMESKDAENEIIRFIEPGFGENGLGIIYAIQMVKLSLRCMARDPADRPSMVEVVSVLLKVQSRIHKVVK